MLHVDPKTTNVQGPSLPTLGENMQRYDPRPTILKTHAGDNRQGSERGVGGMEPDDCRRM